MSDYCYFCGKVGANYSMKRPGYATEEVSIHKGCYLAPKAEGPATKEPEQSPSLGSPSGVVEAAMKVFGDFTYEALRHHKERATKVKEFHAATNLILDALRSLPQAPATPAAAPGASATETPVTGRGPALYAKGPSTTLSGHTQGAEASREEAREWLDSCPTCKVPFPKGGYHNCPAVREAREGCTSGAERSAILGFVRWSHPTRSSEEAERLVDSYLALKGNSYE